jgi:hypothetical protein
MATQAAPITAHWAVRCEFHTTPARATRESAERLLAEVEAAGHCSGAHEIVEVAEEVRRLAEVAAEWRGQYDLAVEGSTR